MSDCMICGSNKKKTYIRSKYWGNDITCEDCASWVSRILKQIQRSFNHE